MRNRNMHVTDEVLAKLQELRAEGLTQVEIGNRLGCSQNWVYRWLAHLKENPGIVHRDAEDQIRAQNLWERGYHPAMISRSIERPIKIIRDWAAQDGWVRIDSANLKPWPADEISGYSQIFATRLRILNNRQTSIETHQSKIGARRMAAHRVEMAQYKSRG